MDEIIKKLNKLRELMAKHDEIISCSIVNIRDSRRAEILVDRFNDVPTERASYTRLYNIDGPIRYEKSAKISGVKIEAYGSINEAIQEMRDLEND